MRRFLDKLAYWMELRGIVSNEVSSFDGIGLVDLRWRRDPQGLFQKTIAASLRLVRDHDPRRYARMKRHIKWIVNRVTDGPMGAEYVYRIRACNIEFAPIPDLAPDLTAAFWAALIVHEATHGAVETRGVIYNERNRARIERLCTAEQNRFAARLAAFDPMRFPLPQFDFDESHWHEDWTASPRRRRSELLSRIFAGIRGEPPKD